MTIKEIETLSGMPRANIRFYESEGFIAPARGENGYRDYSQDDLAVLLRVKLLRSMNMPLEEIKAIHRGQRELSEALSQHAGRLACRQEELKEALALCEAMRMDGVRYDTLDAASYLATADKPKAWTQPEDTLPTVGVWRRFFARWFDFLVYDALWSVFLALVLDVNILSRNGAQSLLDIGVALLLMVLLEPALLHWFGTTPGKWILGISVTDPEERRLTYGDGFARVWYVISRGCGWWIPYYSQIRLYISARDASKGEPLVWEENSLLTGKPNRWWRWVLVVGAYLLLYTLVLLTVQVSAQPGNKDGLTVAEYAANYNELAEYYDVESELRIDGAGNYFIEESGVIQVEDLLMPEELPQLAYTLDEEGFVQSVELCFAFQGGEYFQSVYLEERCLLVWALNAEPRRERTALAEYIAEDPYRSFVRQGYETRVDCDLQYEGYRLFPATGMLIPEDGSERSFHLRYKVEYY